MARDTSFAVDRGSATAAGACAASRKTKEATVGKTINFLLMLARYSPCTQPTLVSSLAHDPKMLPPVLF